MDTIGLDLHKRESQLCILTTEGELVEQRIVTSRDRFTAVLGSRAPARILVEASTESEWVARHLESLGHEVVVADPNFAPMYATRSRRVKTDRRDARTLAEACRLGAFRRAHRASDTQRQVRAELAVRDVLIRTRTRCVAVTKALLRGDGLRLPSGNAEHTERKLAALALPGDLTQSLAPLRAVWAPLAAEITAADDRLAARAHQDPVVARLMTAPSIGPVTAIAFVATLALGVPVAFCMLFAYFYSGGPHPISRTPVGEFFAGGLLGGEIRGETARDQRRDRRGGERHGRDVDQR